MKAIKIRSAGSKADIEAFEKQKVNLVKEQRELRTKFLKKMFPYLWRLERHKKLFSEVSDKSIAQTIETLVKLEYPHVHSNSTWQKEIKDYADKKQAKAANNDKTTDEVEAKEVDSDIAKELDEREAINKCIMLENIVIEKMNKAWQNRKTKLRKEAGVLGREKKEGNVQDIGVEVDSGTRKLSGALGFTPKKRKTITTHS